MKRFIISAVSILLLMCVPVSASALSVPNLNAEGSISVTMTYKGEPVSGGTLTLYTVALAKLENDADYSFEFTEDYRACSVDISDLSRSGISEDIADFTRSNGITGTENTIGSNGKVTFTALKLGLYLLVQETPASGYSSISPFIATVPIKDGEEYVYDVDATPKLDTEPIPDDTTKPVSDPTTIPGGSTTIPSTSTTHPFVTTTHPLTSPSTGTATAPTTYITLPETHTTKASETTTAPTKLPQTGQTKWPIPILGLTGLLLTLFGVHLIISYRKEKYES